MHVLTTDIPGVLIFEPEVRSDARGYFFESFSQAEFEAAAGRVRFVQENESLSRRNVVRGLHYQQGAAAQAKLVRAVRGRILDVAVDLRRGSPTFGRHIAVELSEENRLQLYIPRGLAHGFSVLSDEAVVQYKCDNYYAPRSEGGIAWDDPALGIDWRVPPHAAILSDKDRDRPPLARAGALFEYDRS